MSTTSNKTTKYGVPMPFAQLIQKKDYANLNRYMIERLAFENMRETLEVLTDRSIAQQKSYNFIKENTENFTTNSGLDSKTDKNSLLQALRYSTGYAQIVHLCSAVETFFTYTYLTSFKFYCERNPSALFQSIDGLKKNKKGPDRSKVIINTIKHDEEFSEKAIEQIIKLTYSDLGTVKKMFMQIYGEIFKRDGVESFGSFSSSFNQLKTKRNGILHRGGEYATRRNSAHRAIIFEEDDFIKYYDLALQTRTTLSNYLHLMFRHWWQNEDLALTKTAIPNMFTYLIEANLLEKCNLIGEFGAYCASHQICKDL